MASIQPEKIGADLRRKVESLIEGQGLGVLATADVDGHPRYGRALHGLREPGRVPDSASGLDRGASTGAAVLLARQDRGHRPDERDGLLRVE